MGVQEALKSADTVLATTTSYLQYTCRWSRCDASVKSSAVFSRLVRRALQAVHVCRNYHMLFGGEYASKFSPPRTVVDYWFHDRVVNLLLEATPTHEYAAIYEELVNLMPDNHTLILRAVSFFRKEDNQAMARGTLEMALLKIPYCLKVLKCYVLMHKNVANTVKIEGLLQEGTRRFPGCAWLWKYYFLYRASRSADAATLQNILREASTIGVDLRAAILHIMPEITDQQPNQQPSKI